MQTMMPTKPTETRETIRINLPPQSRNIMQRRFNIVLCYSKASEEDSGWILAGRMKDSLGKALEEEPILAGRLRPSGGGGYEIVSNDGGVRTVEVRADDVKLADFVDQLKANKREADELVFWEDIVEQNPQFSPLIYIQVTNFTCGGYSIGITTSLLLADPFTFSNFLKKWTKIHKTIFSRTNNFPQIPLLYFPKYASPNNYILMGSNYKTAGIKNTNDAAKSVILTFPTKINLHSDNNNISNHKNLAALCIDEAERKTGSKMSSSFALLIHKLPNCDEDGYNNKVEICSRKGLLEGNLLPENNISGLITNCSETWDELGLDSLCFNEGNKADYVSCWISSSAADDKEGSVMIINPSTDCHTNTFGIKIVVTFD